MYGCEGREGWDGAWRLRRDEIYPGIARLCGWSCTVHCAAVFKDILTDFVCCITRTEDMRTNRRLPAHADGTTGHGSDVLDKSKSSMHQ